MSLGTKRPPTNFHSAKRQTQMRPNCHPLSLSRRNSPSFLPVTQHYQMYLSKAPVLRSTVTTFLVFSILMTIVKKTAYCHCHSTFQIQGPVTIQFLTTILSERNVIYITNCHHYIKNLLTKISIPGKYLLGLSLPKKKTCPQKCSHLLLLQNSILIF